MGEAKRKAQGTMPYDATMVRDLTEHAWSKIGPAIFDVMNISNSPETAFQVSLMLLAQVSGACGGALGKLYGLDNSAETRTRQTIEVLDLTRQLVAEGPDAVIAGRKAGGDRGGR